MEEYIEEKTTVTTVTVQQLRQQNNCTVRSCVLLVGLQCCSILDSKIQVYFEFQKSQILSFRQLHKAMYSMQ